MCGLSDGPTIEADAVKVSFERLWGVSPADSSNARCVAFSRCSKFYPWLWWVSRREEWRAECPLPFVSCKAYLVTSPNPLMSLFVFLLDVAKLAVVVGIVKSCATPILRVELQKTRRQPWKVHYLALTETPASSYRRSVIPWYFSLIPLNKCAISCNPMVIF